MMIMTKFGDHSVAIAGILHDLDVFHIKPSAFCRGNTIGPDIELKSLSDSIKEKGLLQPIIVRPIAGFYEIVAGNRRYAACKSLGWRKMSCHVVELNDREALEVSIIENIHRKTLNPIEEAQAFKKYVCDFGWGGVTDLALKIGKSVSYISKRMNLLDMPLEIISSTVNSTTSISIAEELQSIKDVSKQTNLARIICNEKLSVRKARKLIKDCTLNDDDLRNTDNDSHYKMNRTYDFPCRNVSNDETVDKMKRSFDKTIISLRIAMNTLCHIIQATEDNWIVYEILMQHKNMLHSQIDLLIKQKNKIDSR